MRLPLNVPEGGLVLDADLSFQRRTNEELVELLRAVEAAAPEDEVEAVEWKGALDLTKQENVVVISRWIIGVANRSPSTAADQCGGLAYLLIGAEPSAMADMRSWDDSNLRPKIDRYVRGPRWVAHNISIDDRTVLIIAVEPPADGDPIYCLQKEFTYKTPKGESRVYRAGEIVVRVGTSTRPATPADLLMLQDRLLAGGRQAAADLSVQVTHLHVQHVAAGPEEVENWVREQAALIAPARKASSSQALYFNTDIGEPADEYNARVHEFLEECRRRIRKFALHSVTIQGTGAIKLTIDNLSEVTARGVRLTLTCPPQMKVFNPTHRPMMPAVPDPQAKNIMTRVLKMHPSHLDHQAIPIAADPNLSISRSNSAVRIVKRLVDCN